MRAIHTTSSARNTTQKHPQYAGSAQEHPQYAGSAQEHPQYAGSAQKYPLKNKNRRVLAQARKEEPENVEVSVSID